MRRMLWVAVMVARGFARFERIRLRGMLGKQAATPAYLCPRPEDGFWRKALLPLRDVEGWPAYVSLAEARAYARWRGGRLPTEAEFHRAAYGQRDGSERAAPWGEGTAKRERGNFDASV